MKKILAILLACLLVSTAVPVFAQSAPATLVYMTSWEDKPDYNNYIAELGKQFAALHPDECAGVEVLTVPYSGYEAKFATSLNAGTYVCDIFQGQPQEYHDYADPMPEDFAKWVNDNVVDYLSDIGTYKGVRYGIPMEAGNFQQLYINTDMFKAAGLDPDKPPKDFNEILDYAKKLTKYDDNGDISVAGYGIRYSGEGQGVADKNLTIFHAFGAKLFDEKTMTATGYVNGPQAVKALTWIKSLLDNKVTNLEIGVPETAFAQGRAAMITRESWVVGYIQANAPGLNFKVYPIPAVDDNQPVGAGNLFPWAHMVYADSPNKDLAWKFLEYVYQNTDQELEMSKRGGLLPVLKANYNNEYVTSRPDYNSVQAVMERTYRPAYNYYIDQMTELTTIFGNAILSVLYDNTDPQAALDSAAKDMDDILAAYR